MGHLSSDTGRQTRGSQIAKQPPAKQPKLAKQTVGLCNSPSSCPTAYYPHYYSVQIASLRIVDPFSVLWTTNLLESHHHKSKPKSINHNL